MNFEYKVLDYEMVHYADDNLFIAHKANIITYVKNGNVEKIRMPKQVKGIKSILMFFRKTRRLFRLDKAMIQPIDNGFVMVRYGHVWTYKNKQWIKSDQIINGRNPMYNGFLNLDNQQLYIAEYGKPTNIGKRVFRSIDDGYTWQCVYQFDSEEIRHIHCLMWDPFEEKIWIGTGDSDEESRILKADKDFKKVEQIGTGNQHFRTCHFIFKEDFVEWFMDSPLEDVFHVVLDRKTNTVIKKELLDGPIWYAKVLVNEIVVLASTQEIGPSHKDKLIHLYAIVKGKLVDICQYEHDGWPKGYFRFGSICFARGVMFDNSFYISFEGAKGLDGKSALCKLSK